MVAVDNYCTGSGAVGVSEACVSRHPAMRRACRLPSSMAVNPHAPRKAISGDVLSPCPIEGDASFAASVLILSQMPGSCSAGVGEAPARTCADAREKATVVATDKDFKDMIYSSITMFFNNVIKNANACQILLFCRLWHVLYQNDFSA